MAKRSDMPKAAIGLVHDTTDIPCAGSWHAGADGHVIARCPDPECGATWFIQARDLRLLSNSLSVTKKPVVCGECRLKRYVYLEDPRVVKDASQQEEL